MKFKYGCVIQIMLLFTFNLNVQSFQLRHRLNYDSFELVEIGSINPFNNKLSSSSTKMKNENRKSISEDRAKEVRAWNEKNCKLKNDLKKVKDSKREAFSTTDNNDQQDLEKTHNYTKTNLGKRNKKHTNDVLTVEERVEPTSQSDLTDDDYDIDFNSDQFNNILELDKDLKNIFNFTNVNFTDLLMKNYQKEAKYVYLVNNTNFCTVYKSNSRIQPKSISPERNNSRVMHTKTQENSDENIRNISSRINVIKQELEQSYPSRKNRNRQIQSNNIHNDDKSVSSGEFNSRIEPAEKVNLSLLNNTKLVTSVAKVLEDAEHIIENELERSKESCGKCISMDEFLDQMTQETLRLKKNIKLTIERKPNTQLFLYKIASWMMRINLLKADIFKVNELLDLLKTSNCSNQEKNSKKLMMITNASDHLVEVIQSGMKAQRMDLNMVVLG